MPVSVLSICYDVSIAQSAFYFSIQSSRRSRTKGVSGDAGKAIASLITQNLQSFNHTKIGAKRGMRSSLIPIAMKYAFDTIPAIVCLYNPLETKF